MNRTAELTQAALKMAERHGYRSVTRAQIAEAAKVSPALVSARLGSMDAVRRLIMRAAVKAGNVAVVAQGLAHKDPHARRAPEDLKAQALKHIAG